MYWTGLTTIIATVLAVIAFMIGISFQHSETVKKGFKAVKEGIMAKGMGMIAENPENLDKVLKKINN